MDITIYWWIPIISAIAAVVLILAVEHFMLGNKSYSPQENHKYEGMSGEQRLELEKIKEENRAQFWRGFLIFLFVVLLLLISKIN